MKSLLAIVTLMISFQANAIYAEKSKTLVHCKSANVGQEQLVVVNLNKSSLTGMLTLEIIEIMNGETARTVQPAKEIPTLIETQVFGNEEIALHVNFLSQREDFTVYGSLVAANDREELRCFDQRKAK